MWARLLLYIFSFISNIKNLIQFSMFVLIFSNSWFRMHKTTYRKFREKVGPWIPIGMSSNNKNIQLDEILLTWLYCVTGNVPYRHAALACGMKRFVCRFYCNLIVHDYQFWSMYSSVVQVKIDQNCTNSLQLLILKGCRNLSEKATHWAS